MPASPSAACASNAPWCALADRPPPCARRCTDDAGRDIDAAGRPVRSGPASAPARAKARPDPRDVAHPSPGQSRPAVSRRPRAAASATWAMRPCIRSISSTARQAHCLLQESGAARHLADRRRRRPHDHAADPARPVQGRAVRRRAFRPRCRHAGPLSRHQIDHATPFRRLVEEGILDPKRTIQIGLRGTRFADDDIQYGYDMGMRIVTMDDFEEMVRQEVIRERRRVERPGSDLHHLRYRRPRSRLRIGTGVPEPGGLLDARRPGHHPRVAGPAPIDGDVCEVLPLADPSGHTALNAANLMFEMLCVIADSRANRWAR